MVFFFDFVMVPEGKYVLLQQYHGIGLSGVSSSKGGDELFPWRLQCCRGDGREELVVY